MCGLVGYMSSVATCGSGVNQKVFKQMLFADALRGEDSTGVFFGTRKGKAGFYKDALPSYKFLGDKQVDKLLSEKSTAFMVGHNRYATSGDSWDAAGAHPFRHGNIIMVHNGTLSNHLQLPDGGEFIVDSEAICHNLNKHGYDSTIKKLEGAFALIWYNMANNRLCFVRNSERPLWIANTATGIFFASEKKMLEWVLDRNNVHIKSIEQLPEGELRQYDITNLSLPCSIRKVDMTPVRNYWDSYWSKYDKYSAYTPSTKPTVIHHPAKVEDEQCCICSDMVPKTLSTKVRGSDEWVCNGCDESWYAFDGEPLPQHKEWLPPLERV